MATKKHNGFASSIGFVLASAGSAVGLGNIWRFPYNAGKYGGAAFVIVYIAMVLLIGIVGMVAEMYVGKRAQANPVTALKKINPKLGFVGLISVVVPFFIICYYSVLGGYTLRGVVSAFTDIGKTAVGVEESFVKFSSNPLLPAYATFVFLGLAVFIIMGGVQKGIEKMSKILMPMLFIILVGVVIYSLTLGKGVMDGLKYYILDVDFSKLGFDGVAAAMGQVFFSMSLGMGIMISYGSYTGKEINLFKSAVQVSLIDTAVALLAGFAIFPAAYHFGYSDPEILGGPVLMFKTLPLIFNKGGVFGAVVGAFFFLMVTVAAITSVVSLIEVVTQFFIQKFKINRKKAAIFPMILAMVIAIPVAISFGSIWGADGALLQLFGFDLLSFFDEITNFVLMPVCALAVCLAAGYGIKRREFAENIVPGKPFFGNLVSVMIRFVTPFLILGVLISGLVTNFTKYGSNYIAILVSAVVLAVAAVLVYFLTGWHRKNTGCNADELASIAEEE